jgi:hypothetical protein
MEKLSSGWNRSARSNTGNDLVHTARYPYVLVGCTGADVFQSAAGPANKTRFPSGSETMNVMAPQGSSLSG